MKQRENNDLAIWLICGVIALAWAAGLYTYQHPGGVTGQSSLHVNPLQSTQGTLLTGLFLAAICLLVWAVYAATSAHLRRQANMERDLRLTVEEAYRGTLHALTAALDLRDDETYGHSRRVMGYSLAMGRQLGLSAGELQTLAWGALLHDLGKIGIRDSILLKPGPLTREERAEMDQHVVIGQQLVQNVPFLASTHAMIRHHHERFDGTGYPDRLKGEEIPVLARIFTVADAYDAMTSSRPYRREPLSTEQALEIIRQGSGSQFCPRVVEVFLDISRMELEQIRADSYLPLQDHSALIKVEMVQDHPFSRYLRDALTGTLNRAAWEAKVAAMGNLRGSSLGTIVFFDMDKLKQVNDANGHQAGDRLLTDLGARLVQVGPELYRLGGDEFVLWVPPGEWTAEREQKISEILGHFTDYWSQSMPGVTVSWGFASATPDTPDVVTLVRMADEAMYRHKATRSSLERSDKK